MDELVQQAWTRFLWVIEDVTECLEEGVSLVTLETRLQEQLNGLGRDILEQVAAVVDERLHKQREARVGWVIKRRADEKQVLTPFGVMNVERTYFQHKRTGEYRYLADDILGLGPHERVDAAVKAQLVADAVNQSYARSGQWTDTRAWHVSGQTMMKAVRKIAADQKTPPPEANAE